MQQQKKDSNSFVSALLKMPEAVKYVIETTDEMQDWQAYNVSRETLLLII